MSLKEKIFGKRSPTPEQVADTERFRKNQEEAVERLRRLRALPPRQHIEMALTKAGLPGDLELVKNGWLVVRIPMGSEDYICFLQVEAVHLLYYDTLVIHATTSPLTRKPMILNYDAEKQKWFTRWASDESKHPVHHVELV